MGDKPKIQIVATHPVQYQAPWFRHLHNNVHDYDFEVLYITLPDAEKQGIGFGQSFEWDVDLFEGYNWIKLDAEFLAGDGSIDNFFSLRVKHTKTFIQQLNPDAVLLTGWQCLGLMQVLKSCKRLNIPCLIRAESNNLKPRPIYKRLLHRLLLRQYNSFLNIGLANRNFYLTNGILDKNIYSCPYFVDNNFFKEKSLFHKNQISMLKDKWHIPKDAFCFCYVGKLNPKKRILDILKALNLANNPNIHLLVVGNGELITQAQKYVNTHSLNVSFTGFLNQSEITKAYAACDCLILASDYDETWGLVVNEAMACGLPAIVSDRCGCHLDLIQNDETGFVFEFSNIKDLTSKMKTIVSLSDNDFCCLGNQAQLNVSEHYSIEKASEGLVKALNACFEIK